MAAMAAMAATGAPARKHRLTAAADAADAADAAAVASQPVFRWSPLFPRRLMRPARGATPHGDAEGPNLYPNCDVSVWLRSCSEEVLQPIAGTTTGNIPQWLRGSLLRNGPGSLKVGNMTFDHLFDSSALLHRFAISNGNVTYQNRFLQSQTFKRNTAAQRIVVTEFGTKSVPDPCQSIFQRVSAFFTPGEGLSDNAMISIYPFGDEFYTFTESPIIHRVDPASLETLERVNISKYVSIVNHSSHPHVMEDGTVYNLGLTVTGKGPCYAIVKFPPASKDPREGVKSMFDQAMIIGKVPARWSLHPGYMHTFGITEKYFVIVEQPLSVSVPAMIKNQLTSSPMAASFRWYGEEQSQIHLLCRKTGEIRYTFEAEAFFYLHIINCYEDADHVIVDICCYRDPSMLDCMYIDSLKGIQRNPDYARMFRSRPLRFVLPLDEYVISKSSKENLVTLKSSKATAYRLENGRIFACPELLCTLGCETPRINYEKHLGRPYRYFYAISSDVDLENPGTLIKVDIANHTKKTWSEENVYPSEPIFVPHPLPEAEDDGVVLSALVWGKGEEQKVALLVLDATTWQEIGRTVFATPSPVPKCLHGWFTNIV